MISRSRTSSSNPSPPIHQRFAWSVQPPPTVQESRFLYSTVPTRIRTTQRCGVAGAPEITTSNRANPPSWPPGFKAIRPRIPPIQQPPREKKFGLPKRIHQEQRRIGVLKPNLAINPERGRSQPAFPRPLPLPPLGCSAFGKRERGKGIARARTDETRWEERENGGNLVASGRRRRKG